MWGTLTILLGVLYGYFTPGRQNKKDLFTKAILIGFILAVVFALLGDVLNVHPLGLGSGILATIIGAIVLAVLFVLGAYIGDWIEDRRPRRAAP